MSRDRDLNGFNLWKDFLSEEVEKMQRELKLVSDPTKREELKDHLTWLYYQIKNFEKTHDFESMEESLEWVTSRFNKQLNPKDPFRNNPKC